MNNYKSLIKQKKIYLYLMVLPLPAITVSGIIGLTALLLGGGDNIFYKILSTLLSIVTTAAGILLLLLPLWIYRYVKVTGKLDKTR